MTSSKTIRDPLADHMLTPQNAALLVIDFQPVQVTSVASLDRRTLVANITAVARTAKLYGLPIVVTTVNVKTGLNALVAAAQTTFDSALASYHNRVGSITDVNIARTNFCKLETSRPMCKARLYLQPPRWRWPPVFSAAH